MGSLRLEIGMGAQLGECLGVYRNGTGFWRLRERFMWRGVRLAD